MVLLAGIQQINWINTYKLSLNKTITVPTKMETNALCIKSGTLLTAGDLKTDSNCLEMYYLA